MKTSSPCASMVQGATQKQHGLLTQRLGARMQLTRPCVHSKMRYDDQIAEAAKLEIGDRRSVRPTGSQEETIGRYLSNQAYLPDGPDLRFEAWSIGCVFNRLGAATQTLNANNFSILCWKALEQESLSKSAGASDIVPQAVIAEVCALLIADAVPTQHRSKNEALSR